MARVKGSKQIQMIVVPKRIWHEWQGKVAMVVIGLLTSLLLFRAGRFFELSAVGQDEASLSNQESKTTFDSFGQRLSTLISRDSVDVRNLQTQLLRAEQSTKVDKLVLQDLRTNIQRLRQQISQLEEDVLFYKNIANAGSQETGLVIAKLDLLTKNTANHYRYIIKFEQAGKQDRTLEGFVTIAVAGLQEGMELTLPLTVLSNSMQGENIKLRFRSSQDIEGELTLPAGFEPERLEVLAVTEAPDSKTLQKNFSWLVESNR